MTARIRHITIDARDPYQLSLFWSSVTGFGEKPDNVNLPEHDEAMIMHSDGGPGLLFIRVPEEKVGKNRLHVDLVPTDRTRDEEVERLRRLGAALVADHRQPDGPGWVVLADPEGNEFCVERSLAERSQAGH